LKDVIAELDGQPVIEHVATPAAPPPIARRQGPPVAVGRVTARAAVWARIRRRARAGDGFTKNDLALEAGVSERTVDHHVTDLVAAGLLRGTPGARPNEPWTYHLSAAAGAEPPRVRTGGRVARPSATELIWAAMKGLRNFNVAELAEAAGVPRGTAARYLTDLRRGGYLALVERSGPDRLARWLLLPHMDSGALAPAVRSKDKAVFDRNLGRMVWPSKAA
jgi:DNA-binding transcriptional ArsR family regulator